MPLDLDNMTFDDVVEANETVTTEEARSSAEGPDTETTANGQETYPPEEEQTNAQEEEEETSDPENKEETQEEEENKEGEEETVPLVQQLQNDFGFDELEENEYGETEEDLRNLSRDAAEVMAANSLDNLFQQHPHVQQFLEFSQNGGDAEEYFQTIHPTRDYQEIEIEEDNEVQQRRIVEENLRENSNLSDKRIEAKLDRWESTGVLFDEAEDALSELRTTQEQRKEDLIERQRHEREQREQEIEEFWNEFKQDLDRRSQVGGLSIPESEKNDFFQFLSQPVTDQGHSGRDAFIMGQGEESISEEGRFLLDYITFQLKKNGVEGVAGMVGRKASSKKAGDLRDRLKNSGGDNSPNGQPDPSTKRQGDASDVPELKDVM